MNIQYKLIILLISVLSLQSCGDEYDFLNSVKPVEGSAKLKIIHAAPDTSGIVIKIDNQIVSGVNTILSTTVLNPGVINFGSFFPLSEYFTVATGNKKMTVGFATADPKVTVDLNSDLTLAANKFYSAYIVGTKPTYTVIYGEDDLTAFDPNKTHIRFVNTVSNTPAEGYEILVNNVVTDTKVKLTTGTDAFIPFDQDGNVRFTIIARQKGTTVALSTLSNLNFLRGKKYTVLVRGIHASIVTAQRVTIQNYTNN